MIIEYLKIFKLNELEDFEKELVLDLEETIYLIIEIYITKLTIMIETDTSGMNKNLNKLNISYKFTKIPKKKNYLEILEESKKNKIDNSINKEFKEMINENPDNNKSNLDNSMNSIKSNLNKGNKKNKTNSNKK